MLDLPRGAIQVLRFSLARATFPESGCIIYHEQSALDLGGDYEKHSWVSITLVPEYVLVTLIE